MSGYFVVGPSEGPKQTINWQTIQDMNEVLITRQNLEREISELEETARQMGHSV